MQRLGHPAPARDEPRIQVDVPPAYASLLTPAAETFLAGLARRFSAQRDELLTERIERQRRIDAGELPDFLAATEAVRRDDWRVTATPADLADRRVEITGPVDRKMVINALNSGAQVYMADFEDAHAPTWEATLAGQANLRDAVTGDIEFVNPDGKRYALNPQTATLIVRPRGWHLSEKHFRVDGARMPAGLFDFGLFLYHNGRRLLGRGSGPYFYLPKLEGHREARLWSDVFRYAERELALPQGAIKATVLIETLPAAFEMDEILYELRDYCIGLNCGRWDYIFSFIKKFRNYPDYLLPDRAQVGMTCHFLRAYSQLLIRTCHRRRVHAMGGMAAQIPIRGDEKANAEALAKVRADKEREAGDGHDGTWVAHPGLVPVAREVFDRIMPGSNQLDRLREDVVVGARDLLTVPSGTITEAGLRNNIDVGVQYLGAWLGGLGCVPIHHLMEDAATAEIARAQIWQWIRHPRGTLDDGRRVTAALFRELLDDELARLHRPENARLPGAEHYAEAAQLLTRLVTDDAFAEFFTLETYERLA